MLNDPVDIRAFDREDAPATLEVFLAAVRITAAADYSSEQINAWAGERNATVWEQSLAGRDTYVAVVAGQVVGFGDVAADGHIEMLFVAPDCGRRGVAGQLLDFLEATAREHGATCLSADVSITARPRFERSGFVVVAQQHPVRDGVELVNFAMTKHL